jgi:DnaK suppressor protein
MAKATRTTTTAAPVDLADRYQELKSMLEERRREMVDELHGRIRGVRTESASRLHEGQDPVETAEVEVQGDLAFALIQMKSETLDRVNEALARLEDGRYGCCYDCGDDIAEARLRALPFAVRCRDCEEDREAAFARTRAELRRGSSAFFEMPR